MEAIKIKKTKSDFTLLPNSVLRSKEMSLKAKGLLAYLLSLPDDWKLYVSELKNHCKDGKDSITSAFNELIDLGYIEREESEKKAGRFTGYNYTVLDVPNTTNRCGKSDTDRCGFTASEKPEPENPQLLNTNRLNTNRQNIDNKLSIINADLVEIFNRWLNYKRQKRQTYKSEDSTITCYKKLIKDSDGELYKAEQIIENAIANNYSGFFALKSYQEPENEGGMVW